MFNTLSNLKMADEFMRTVKQLREWTSSSKEGHVDFLCFPVPNPRQRSLNFTPQREGRVLVVVAATQEDEDMESDSLSSHTSRPRKRLLAPWKPILVNRRARATNKRLCKSLPKVRRMTY